MTSKARAKSWHISSLDGLKPSELEKIAYGLSELQAEVALHDWLKHARPEQIAPDGDWAQWLFLVEVPARREQARSGFARYDEADTIRDFILELKKLWSKLAHWSKHARPEQLAPDGDWAQWLFLAGRGAGKTRAGSEWVRSMVKAGFKRGGMIAPTASDARDVMVEGSSGLLATAWKFDKDIHGKDLGVPVYEPTKRRVHWDNGAMVTTFSVYRDGTRLMRGLGWL